MTFIYAPSKAVVVTGTDFTKYKESLPVTKEIVIKGKRCLAIPHKPNEVKTLHNLGVDVPAPMNMYYPYEGMFKPFDVQKQTAEFATMNDRCFILNSMGLGKTVTALWAADYLHSIHYVNRVLVVCPISVMERTWGDEIFRTFPNKTYRVLYGSKDKRIKLLKEEADIYIVNTDGLKVIKDELETRPDIDLIIIDELAMFRNPQTDRWKVANLVCNKQVGGNRRVWGMTGSPTPNSPTDAFGQIKLVTPKNPSIPRYFSSFRNMVMLQVSTFKFIPKPDAATTVSKCMQPAVRFSLDDAVDLPPQIVSMRKVELSSEQKKAFKDMMMHLRTQVDNGEVLAVNEAVKASKLLQICCGVAYDDNSQPIPLNSDSRLETLNEVVEESECKTLVFVPFKGALHKACEFLRKKGHTVEIVDGDTPKAERDTIFYNFQKNVDPQVIIANPGTMSHGLTLIAATTICWYGPCYSNEIYQQACARVRRPGQKHTTVIVQMVSTTFEEKIYERIDKKQSIQGLLLDLVHDNNNIT